MCHEWLPVAKSFRWRHIALPRSFDGSAVFRFLPPGRLAIVNPPITLAQRCVAEGTGTPLLLAAVVGSGIMSDVWVPNDITAPVAGACVGVFVAHAMFPS